MPSAPPEPAAKSGRARRGLGQPGDRLRRLGLDVFRHRDRDRDDAAVPHGGDPVRHRRPAPHRVGTCSGTPRRAGSRPRRQLLDSVIVGALLLGVAQRLRRRSASCTVPSGVAAILVAMMPLWFALLRLDLLPASGCRGSSSAAIGLGFVGTALLVAPTGEGANNFDPLGILILFCAPIAWAHGSMYSAARAKLPPSPLSASGLQMLAGSAVYLRSRARQRRAGEVPSGADLDRRRSSPSSTSSSSGAWSRSPRMPGSSETRRCRSSGRTPTSTRSSQSGSGTLFLGESLSLRTIVGLRDHRDGRGDHRDGSKPAAARRSPTRLDAEAGQPEARQGAVAARPASGRRSLREHRPADPPGHRHHRDHRVDADAPSGTSRCPRRRGPRMMLPRESARTRPRSSAGCVAGSEPIRIVPIWWADAIVPRCGRKSIAASRSSKAANRRTSRGTVVDDVASQRLPDARGSGGRRRRARDAPSR